MGTNQILPFCPTDTGTNLETQVDYAADTSRTNGNQPGIAKSKLVNKAMRQAAWMASQLAQYMVNVTGQDVLDDQNSTNLLATMGAAFQTGLNPVFKSAAYTAAAKDFVICSSASWSVTLPDASAAGVKGLMIGLRHAGTSLTQLYTILTTSGQTISGIASGSYILSTNGEVLTVISDGANWQIVNHSTSTGVVSGGTLAISATTAYVFTVTSANATIGATYTNGGQTFTVSATIAGATTLNCSGTGTPGASGTLTKTSGIGDATISFSSRTITGVPAFGTTTTNAVSWYRQGAFAVINYSLVQSGSGTAGVGDYILSLPAGLSAISTYPTYLPAGTSLLGIVNAQNALLPSSGITTQSATSAATMNSVYAYLYASNSIRLSYYFDSTGGIAVGNWGSSSFAFNTTAISVNVTVTVPIQ